QLTVNPRTAHEYLQLSEGNRKITNDASNPNYNRGFETFLSYAQTLCTEALQERCYWEVEWEGQQVYIAMSYIELLRMYCSDTVSFGFNDKSWSLRCNSSQFAFFHDSYKKVISGPLSRRIGIYLDHRARTLSFYSITDTMKLLHRVGTLFTEPLYGGFWVFDDSSVKLC
ncbi:stonustoxin subunit alpha-like, partial [Silurus meridionalis]